MKRIIIGICALAAMSCAGLAAYAANKGSKSNQTITRSYDLGNFKEIDVSFITVELSQGPAGKATLTGPENLVDKVLVRCKGDEVEIDVPGNNNTNKSKNYRSVVLKASSSDIQEIKAALAAKVNVDKLTSNAKVDLETETAAGIEVGMLCCNGADFEAETAGSIVVGEIRNDGVLDASAETAANINIKGGNAGAVKLSAETAGNISVKASISSGRACAETGGCIKADKSRLSVSTDTGGSVKNNK